MTAMTDTTCNGWSNYATWRVNLELCDDMLQSMLEDTKYGSFDFLKSAEYPRVTLSDWLKETCEDLVCEQGDADTLAKQYALAFLSEVDWYRIADNFLSDNAQLLDEEDHVDSDDD